MGGEGEIALAAASESAAESAIATAVAEVARIETKYSRYRSGSWLSRLNDLAGTDEWSVVDDETCALLAHVDRLYASSGGLFDITSGALRRVWRFDEARLPDPARLRAVLADIGWSRVERGGNGMRLPPGLEVDFGGFGKEYAADRAAETLLTQGFRHGLVNLAGDVRVLGPQPDGAPWVIGIQSPRNPGELLASIPLTGGGLATSGDYERFFELDGERYCHILNPRSGFPVTYWRSVSVIASNALTAGGLATQAMLLEGEALPLLRRSGFKFLALNRHNQIFTQ